MKRVGTFQNIGIGGLLFTSFSRVLREILDELRFGLEVANLPAEMGGNSALLRYVCILKESHNLEPRGIENPISLPQTDVVISSGCEV